MTPQKRQSLLILAMVMCIPATAVLAFFLAGAVVFPLANSYYATRVLLSFGLMALVYGVECVLNWGTIETCGFLSGNCSTHNMQGYAMQIWAFLVVLCFTAFIAMLLRERKTKSKK